ncbi:MAG TPA: HAMP domain-containing protein [Anaerolineae bacterium]|nr:HAMP domain-containing protein [Anaerolineae bacterium]
MTTNNQPVKQSATKESFHFLDFQWFKNLNIGAKLSLGFGVLVVLLMIVALSSYFASTNASDTIQTTNDVSFPIAFDATSARINLLRMQADVRGYLALGDARLRDSYVGSDNAFQENLAELQRHAVDMDATNRSRLKELNEAYARWAELPDQLFDLRNDRLAREPAYQTLAIDGVNAAGQVLLDVKGLITAQSNRSDLADNTQENVKLLGDMADFQGSFAAVLSGLRNYVATQNRVLRQEYDANLALNNIHWATLQDKRARGLMTPDQAILMDRIAQNRAEFLLLAREDILPIIDGDESRADLILFNQEAVPQIAFMIDLLEDMSVDQQTTLRNNLSEGNEALSSARGRTIIVGIAAAVLGALLSIVLQSNIVGPIGRLTTVADHIRSGNLNAQAPIESNDEIGILARTFNNMTSRLAQTLLQVRKEKTRADNLLDVVIPIGVDLSSEKDFNRLLEKMLVEAQNFCNANVGILYLLQDDVLKFVIVRNNKANITMGGTSNNEIAYKPIALKQVAGQTAHPILAASTALKGVTHNIADARQITDFDFSGPANDKGYYGTSYLSIPLKNTDGDVVGVLELIDAQDVDTKEIVPFDVNLQQMMESFSSLAVAALIALMREQSLRQEIQKLRIEIDEAKREKQVEEIISSDFFRDLESVKKRSRRRRPGASKDQQEEQNEDSN